MMITSIWLINRKKMDWTKRYAHQKKAVRLAERRTAMQIRPCLA